VIGVASPAFCAKPFDETLATISKHFSLWEILPEGEHHLNEIEKGILYGRDSLDLKFQIHAPMTDVNIGSVYEPMRLAALKEIRNVISVCRELDIRLVTIHPGFVNGIAFLDRSKVFEATKRSVRELAPFAKDNSVHLALENMPANINATCTAAADLVEAVQGTDVGLCFDMGHANTSNQLDEMLKHKSEFRNVHLHNNDGQWDQHNRIDHGTADLDRVLRALKGSYDGNLIIEATGLDEGIESKRILEDRLL